jgi:hypothetical protein
VIITSCSGSRFVYSVYDDAEAAIWLKLKKLGALAPAAQRELASGFLLA